MNQDDYRNYWIPAYLNCVQVGVFRAGRMKVLEELLGCTILSEYIHRNYSEDFPLPEKWRSVLQALAGPHCRAVLKVYQLKHGGLDAKSEQVET